MPLDIDWHIPYRVIRVHATGIVKTEDFDHFAEVSVRLLSEAQTHAPGTLVYNIFDSLEVDIYPPVYLMLGRALPVLRFKNRGPLFLITQNRATSTLFELTAHVTNFSLRVFKTHEEALEVLELALAKDNSSIVD